MKGRMEGKAQEVLSRMGSTGPHTCSGKMLHALPYSRRELCRHQEAPCFHNEDQSQPGVSSGTLIVSSGTLILHVCPAPVLCTLVNGRSRLPCMIAWDGGQHQTLNLSCVHPRAALPAHVRTYVKGEEVLDTSDFTHTDTLQLARAEKHYCEACLMQCQPEKHVFPLKESLSGM